ncbi:hypothetical protein [Polynucleobacter sp. MWH-UH23A]|uniref:bestrophin-like domain n=1 Tax=Polynucleobacter sp. MWH-UH23A TaxID=1855613 RepID=UPI003364C02D
MFKTYFHLLSDGALLFIFPILSCATLFLIAYLFRRYQKRFGLSNYDPDILDTATQNTMSGGYVVLGFVLVLAMTTVSELESGVSKEAAAIRGLDRMLVLEGSPPALESRKYLLEYTKSILQDEWPVLKDGQGSQKTSLALRNLFNALDQIGSGAIKDNVVYSKVLEQADKVAELRNNRNYNVQSNLPDTFYIVSLISIIGVILICSLRLIEATRVRIIALTIQIIMLTLMFSAIVIIDLPYIGDTVTSSEPIQKAYESILSQFPTQ